MDQRLTQEIDAEMIPDSMSELKKARNPRFETFCQEFVESDLLTKSQNPETVFKQKVNRKVLMLDGPEENTLVTKPAIKKRALNRKQKKEMGLHDIAKDQQKYCMFEPLHKLWAEYIEKLLGGSFKPSDESFTRIARADLHGAKIMGKAKINKSLLRNA